MFIVLYKYFLCVWWIKRFFSVRKLLNVLNDSGSKNEIDKEYSIITVKATHHQSPAGGALRDFNPKADDHSKLLWFFIFSCILIYYIQRQDPVIISSRPRQSTHSTWLAMIELQPKNERISILIHTRRTARDDQNHKNKMGSKRGGSGQKSSSGSNFYVFGNLFIKERGEKTSKFIALYT